MVAMQHYDIVKTCITHKQNLRIDWKFGNKLILSVSTELCHKNVMLGSQNGPLSGINRHEVTFWCFIQCELFRAYCIVGLVSFGQETLITASN